ncbi:MAG TPA: hypothetical protein VK550_00475, partial [Polyangiaceae bacterium]|nr:hypothetical protein [Polyangiaceae bacterium]
MELDELRRYYFYNYEDAAAESLCKCDHYTTAWGNKVHCIQSREQLGGAMNEGYGHAFASRAFNFTQLPRATFVYYKPFLPNLGVTPLNPPRAFDAFNTQRWMENHCTSSGRGVEYDWAFACSPALGLVQPVQVIGKWQMRRT